MSSESKCCEKQGKSISFHYSGQILFEVVTSKVGESQYPNKEGCFSKGP